MKFRTAYDHPFEYPSVEYPNFDPEYRMVIDSDTGCEKLEVVGKANFIERMSVDAQECCLKTQLNRAQRSGDMSFLGQSVEAYIDTLVYPKTFMELENVRAQANAVWSSAPLEIRERYGNNVRAFLKDLDSKLLEKQKSKLAAQLTEVNNG